MTNPSFRVDPVNLHHEWRGSEQGEVIVLVQGLGLSALAWPETFLEVLVDGGYRLLLIDNRDSGKSPALNELGSPNLVRHLMSRFFSFGAHLPPYSLNHMADDVIELMSRHGVEKAHVMGMSMGGMIAQILAINYPERFASLTSLMSTTGCRRVAMPKWALLKALLASRPKTREERIAEAYKFWSVLSSPAYPTPKAELMNRLNAFYDRGYHPTGTMRQLAAIFSAPSRFEGLQKLVVPSQVIHGSEDPLVPLKAGKRTAKALGIDPVVYPGMGHEIPEQLAERIALDVSQHASANRYL